MKSTKLLSATEKLTFSKFKKSLSHSATVYEEKTRMQLKSRRLPTPDLDEHINE